MTQRDKLDISELVAQLQAVIDTAIDGIITISSSGIVESINKSGAEIFGYKQNEIIGHNITKLMPEPYHSEHDGYLHRYHETREPHIIGIGRDVKGLKKDGEIFPFRLAVGEVILNNRVIYTGIIHDQSEIHEAQNKLLLANEALERKVEERTKEIEMVVNRLLETNRQLEERETALEKSLKKEQDLGELKSRFVTMASHEFRTPLSTILSSAALISRYTANDQQVNREKHVDRIKSAVTNLTGILNDFLSLGKLEEGIVEVRLVPVNLEDICTEVADEIEGFLKEGQTLRHESNPNMKEILSDKRILKNILFNLISNAVKYSGPQDEILCRINSTNEYFEFEIEDQGIGIPEGDQKYLFTRFFRASNVENIQGTGIGLQIVKRYVDLLNGDIQFKSEMDKGTVFTVRIPNHKSGLTSRIK